MWHLRLQARREYISGFLKGVCPLKQRKPYTKGASLNILKREIKALDKNELREQAISILDENDSLFCDMVDELDSWCGFADGYRCYSMDRDDHDGYSRTGTMTERPCR